MQLQSTPTQPTSPPTPPPSPRLAWIEGIRILAAVMILLYHAQLYFENYAYTPQPFGLAENWQAFLTNDDRARLPLLFKLLTAPFLFGFQFLDVFILLSGFSLVLSLKGRSLQTGEFLKKRLLRLLLPFWTVAWLSYPVLWAIGTLTNSYKPDAWSSFTGVIFPLTVDYRGSVLLSTSGPWWFIPLILSFTAIFPILWRLLQRWGSRNLLIFSLGITLLYRTIATYGFGGHPTYVVFESSAGEQPFQLFLARLSTFVIGMVIAQAYQRGQGVLSWSQGQAAIGGGLVYAIGFLCQFFQPGWIVVDLLLPVGLFLLCMVLTRFLEKFTAPFLMRLGACSYSFFLIHDFVVERVVNLWVKDELWRYLIALPLMISLTFLLAWIADALQPAIVQIATRMMRSIDARFRRRRLPNNIRNS